MSDSLKSCVRHWKRKLQRTDVSQETVISTIQKLSKVPMTMKILVDTGIGPVIRSLAKQSGIIGSEALSVLKKWKAVVTLKVERSSSHKDLNPVKKIKDVLSESTATDHHFHEAATGSLSQKSKSLHKHKSNHKKHLSESFKQKTSLNKEITKAYNNENIIKPDSRIKPESFTNYIDYDPNDISSVGYCPSNPALFPETKVSKSKSSLQTKLSSSFKTEMIVEDNSNSMPTKIDSSKHKKIKTKHHKYHPNKLTSDIKPSLTNKNSFNSEIVLKEPFELHKLKEDKMKNHKSHRKKKKGKSNDTLIFDAPRYKCASECLNAVKTEKIVAKHQKKTKRKKSKNNSINIKISDAEVFTASEVRFEDCLGFNDLVPVKKKKLQVAKDSCLENSVSIPSKRALKNVSKTLLKEKQKFLQRSVVPQKLINEVNIEFSLPQTQPNYIPLPKRSFDCYGIDGEDLLNSTSKKKVMSNEEAIKFTSSRKEKTAVYSGKKTGFYHKSVPTLLDSCIRVLIDNIENIGIMNNFVPYMVLKPVLERCTAEQLQNIEYFNPHLLEDSQGLWEVHCKRDFRNYFLQENETWRELYWRAHDERETKLKSITANITASMSKSNPVRQVKLAYVDSVVKPPRDVLRKQAKSGTAASTATFKPKSSEPIPSSSKPVSMSNHSAQAFVPKKPKVAPLMAKTLKSMKQCFRR